MRRGSCLSVEMHAVSSAIAQNCRARADGRTGGQLTPARMRGSATRGHNRTVEGAMRLADGASTERLALAGITKRFSRRRRQCRCEPVDTSWRDPCPAWRERRRQVDAGQDDLRHPAAGRGRDPLERCAARRFANPHAARALGIGMVFQHFSLFEAMTVLENVSIGLDNPERPARLAERIRTGQRRLRPAARPAIATSIRSRSVSASASRSCAAFCSIRSCSSWTSRPRC